MHTLMLDIDERQRAFTTHALIFDGQNPNGPQLTANSRYFLRDGSPWFPITGEIHYSRYPKAYWEESLLKMKAGGITIIASYVFWLHHEEIKRQITWEGNNDLRTFVELCAKHCMNLLLRIGPWCHGEARNGGFPDWLLKKEYEPRTNDDRYFARVREWYTAIYQQVKGLFYKDGGPIIGIQIENEYGHCGGLRGEEGKRHMLTLKRMAQEIGFDVPFYTATGWGGAVVVEDELMPVMGAYASLPWTQHTNSLPPSVHYLFSETRDDFLIGADLATQDAMLSYTPEKYPFALAELGPGNQCTYHRRPRLSAQDVEAMVLVKLGSGANLIGYYMYHGGSNPVGQLSTMEESKATGYLNDLPVLSYDFQAPIREYGQISDKYKALKVLHLFLHDFGAQLAQTSVTLPADNPTDPGDAEALRYAARDHNSSGFLFVNNHQRRMDMTAKPACHIMIQTEEQAVTFPEFSLRNGRSAIFPYNFPVGDMTLRCATVQPLCRISSDGADYIMFFAYPDIPARYIFEKQQLRSIQAQEAEIEEDAEHLTAHVQQGGTESIITLQSPTGNTVHCVTLTREQAENAWKADVWGYERLILSSADVTWTADEMSLCITDQETVTFSMFPDIDSGLEFGDRRSRHLAAQQPDSPPGSGAFLRKPLGWVAEVDKMPGTGTHPYPSQEGISGSRSGSKTEIPIPVREFDGQPLTGRQDGIFTSYTFSVPRQEIPVSIKSLPDAKDGARQWEIHIAMDAMPELNDIFLHIDFEGDVGQIFLGDELVADWFYDGRVWEIGLKRFADRLRAQPFRLRISPLTTAHKVYLETRPDYDEHGVALTLNSVTAVPQYRVNVHHTTRGIRVPR